MGLSKCVLSWSVEDVLEWAHQNHPAHMSTLHRAIIKHDISGESTDFILLTQMLDLYVSTVDVPFLQTHAFSNISCQFFFHRTIPNICAFNWFWFAYVVNEFAGRALLRLKQRHLELLGVEDEEQQQEILQDLLLLRVQEEISELSDICSGENTNAG